MSNAGSQLSYAVPRLIANVRVKSSYAIDSIDNVT